MAGYIGMYLFGDDRGNDGVNSIYLGILVGTSDRQWLEPIQIKQSKNVVKPVWDIEVIIPDPDNYQNSLIDADRKSTRLNSSHSQQSRMPSSA